MSDIYAVFKFSLRGKDSLASKWIDEKRNPQGTLKENGANVFAIGDYLYEVLCIEKLTEGKTTKNNLYAKIKILNSLSNDSIIKFEDVIDIPFIHSTKGIDRMVGENFTKIADCLAAEKINDGENTLGEVLTADEIKIMAINVFHINYDRRDKEGIAGKTYDEIISKPMLYYAKDTVLNFFVPTGITIKENVILQNQEEPIQQELKQNSQEPEVVEEAVEGYFYIKDTGEFIKSIGSSKKCYAVTEKKDNYVKNDVEDLKIKHDILVKKAATVYGESTAYKYDESSKNANNEIFAIAEVYKVNSIAYGGKSSLAKDFISRTDEENNAWESRKAAIASIIYTQLTESPMKYCNGANHWDGAEQAIYDTDKRGVTKDENKKTEGAFTNDTLKSKFELHMNTWGWYIQTEHYNTWKINIGSAFVAPQKKKATVGKNKGKICVKSTAVYNKTIFWKEKSGGYSDNELQ